jgi:predicted amino acid racemase
MSQPFSPRLEIHPQRIAENARQVVNLCHTNNIQVAGVGKVVCAHPGVIRALEQSGVDMLADSRLENLALIRQNDTHLPLMLLRGPTPSRAVETVQLADISLSSDAATAKRLSEAALALDKTHKVILMIDLGDLREGVWPDQAEVVLRGMLSLPNLEVLGLGANLACYGGVIPTAENMQQLVNLRNELEKNLAVPLPVLCGGNSANLPLLLAGGMPSEINLLRIGETILLGRNVLDRSPFPGTRQDTFHIAAEIIELERKPSVPIGLRGQDAFGGEPEFLDRGIRRRAICNIGRQDVKISNLTPVDPGIIILGGSSDHLLLDVQDAEQRYNTGDVVHFLPGYAALLAASTSPYVKKVVVNE